MHINGPFFHLLIKKKTFQKLALLPSSGETLLPNQLGSFEKVKVAQFYLKMKAELAFEMVCTSETKDKERCPLICIGLSLKMLRQIQSGHAHKATS
jgi:hypothetical protein